MATDLLARIRGEIEERMAGLRPLLSEYERLIAAVDTLTAMAAEPVLPDGPPTEETPTAAEPTAAEPTAAEPTAAKPTAAKPTAAKPTAEMTPSAPAPRPGRPWRGSAAGAFAPAMSLRTTPPLQPVARRPAAERGEPPAPRPTTTETVEWTTPSPTTTETVEWTTPSPSAAVTDKQLASAHRAAEASEPEAPTSLAEDAAHRREPVSPAAAQQAILAALEHGSHTPGELVMVTAMSATEIRGNLSRLARRGAIAKVRRDGDGKAAYALRSAPARV